MTGTIFDIKRFAIHDGPGIRSSVFLKGCPLRCLWCQNPEGQTVSPVLWYFPNKCIQCGKCIGHCSGKALGFTRDSSHYIKIDREKCTSRGECVENCPTGALSFIGKKISLDEVVKELLKDKLFYEESGGGITVSGGDPLVQSEFSLAILKEMKKRGIHTAIETCMYGKEEIFRNFFPLTDLFLVDLKLFNPMEHRKFTGVDNTLIKSNFRLLIKENKNVIVRIPLIPDHTSTRKNLSELAGWVKKAGDAEGKKIPIELVNFNPLARDKYKILGEEYALAKYHNIYTDVQMEEFRRIVAEKQQE